MISQELFFVQVKARASVVRICVRTCTRWLYVVKANMASKLHVIEQHKEFPSVFLLTAVKKGLRDLGEERRVNPLLLLGKLSRWYPHCLVRLE